ncbi:UDP-2,3-diacylglucosamine diphosphatase [Azospira inquinata]|uniref:UDP-2,3-diacylglucosamine diphosphatase n=1 Tax=Azospira inquinata TaxID=2785627 RepID=A0A975SM44_9RHOO|nr:UDP-2,3-diacylglucosamine diphosphatase [Azospira inquinata]QWT46060.1 UDP-2,3-diacylglucosamine diphosphatase [Azospira inquinata]QWT48611.1 UDP-2,3-diacylglucosamine diphosphatase [Azospira inquinata]
MVQVRAIFISDVHLGTRACQADRLLDFLREHPSEHLYLIGDIVDFWSMSRGIYWTPAQNTVVQKILRRARHGGQVMLIPGNHDEALRAHDGLDFGGIRVQNEHIHVTADGKRLLLVHGDEFDQVTRYHRWVAVLGDMAYNLLVRINTSLSWFRRRLGLTGYWSLAGYAKRKVKTAINFIFNFEDSVVRAVKERQLDGVVCGHIHWAALRQVEEVLYINCGDWVDSCTGIVEHLDGRLELITWGNAPVTASAAEVAEAPSSTSSPERELEGLTQALSREMISPLEPHSK